MDTYILDTNLLFNMEAKMGLGDNTKRIMTNLAKVTSGKGKSEISIVLPPTIVQEIVSFFDSPDDEVLTSFLGSITVKSPETRSILVSGSIFSELTEDYRNRSFRAMKVAEEEMTRVAEVFMGKAVLPKKEFQITLGKVISKFRDRYRNVTRTGTLDSVADLDVIILAKELCGTLVSSDEGLSRWARQFAVVEMDPRVFGKKMKAYL